MRPACATARRSLRGRALRRVLAATAVALLGVACATPIGVRRTDSARVHRDLTANVLSTGKPGEASTQVLHRLDLMRRYRSEPEPTLAALHRDYLARGNADQLFALAELSFHHASRTGKRTHYLAAAVYAYAFVFPESGSGPDPLDPRLRTAAILYNRGLTKGLASDDGAHVRMGPVRAALPFGRLEVAADPAEFEWAGFRLVKFVPVAEFEVRGLRNRYRRSGIGAPLAADLAPLAPDASLPPASDHVPPGLKVPVTAFLRLPNPRAGIAAGSLRGSLEIYPTDLGGTVTIGGRAVPLEAEYSSSLAYTLSAGRIWEFELRGFFSGDFQPFLQFGDGLIMPQPHKPGRTPIVLVHGTASSPGRWGEMMNELLADPMIRERCEFWLFIYNTGNPVAYSAGLLREALSETVAKLDPEGRDPALRRMVVIGHSQGGLLTKLTVVHSGDRLWRNVSDVPLDDLDVAPETRAVLRRSLFLEPLPFVRRVIFIATPHGGSYLAEFRVAGLVKRATNITSTLGSAGLELFRRNPEALPRREFGRVPSSVDNMTPDDPFLRALAELPIGAGVTAHSIIAVRGDGPAEEGNDGVVEYTSAHLEDAASEVVVRSSHSVQGHPLAIGEVDRILREHLEEP